VARRFRLANPSRINFAILTDFGCVLPRFDFIRLGCPWVPVSWVPVSWVPVRECGQDDAEEVWTPARVAFRVSLRMLPNPESCTVA